MRSTLIITTYNRPDVLNLVLRSVSKQSIMPHEVIVADDGSTSETAEVVDAFDKLLPIPVMHAWQPDKGFRASRVRNLGASKATGDYLIFIDGDMVLHRDFIKSHKQLAQKGAFLHGPRVLITKKMTDAILSQRRMAKVSFFNVPMSHRFNTIHSFRLARIFTRNSSCHKSRACNLSLFKADFIRVNGFNEDFVGWGEEDSEFAWRLIHSGLKKRNIRFAAVEYHLDHENHNEVANTHRISRNIKLFADSRKNGGFRCANGFDKHISSKTSEPLYEVVSPFPADR